MFTTDKKLLVKCDENYEEFCDNHKNHVRETKIINNFLCELPDGSNSIEIADLERMQKAESIKTSSKIKMLENFIQAVKNECVINQKYFIFFDIPDLIVKKKYSRKDYEDIIKVLTKVKTRYLAKKALDNPDTPLELVSQITDDDLAELQLFEDVLSQLRNKLKTEREQTINYFI